MKIEVKVNIKPFPVPGYVDEAMDVARAPVPAPASATASNYCEFDPANYQPSYRTFALRELSVVDLAKLCDDFTESVFKAAGKTRVK
jgi:hypothetical protein